MRALRLAIVLLALSLLAGRARAVDMGDFYRSARTKDGLLYFVMQRKMERASGDEVGSKLLYDYTYLGGADSVRLLLTLKSRAPYRVDTLRVGGQVLPLNTVFKETDGKWWTSRMEAWLEYEAWERIYGGEQAAVFSLGGGVSYSLSARKWRKLRRYYGSFFEVVRLNEQ